MSGTALTDGGPADTGRRGTIRLYQPAPDDLRRRWTRALFNRTGLEKLPPALAALPVILAELGWSGAPRALIEALPMNAAAMTPEDLTDCLYRLGYRAIPLGRHPGRLAGSLAPLLRIDRRGGVGAVVRRGDRTHLIDGSGDDGIPFERVRGGRYLRIQAVADGGRSAGRGPKPAGERWSRELIDAFRPILATAFAASLIINILGVAVPIAIMIIYDQVVGKEEPDALVFVASGVAIAFVFDLVLRLLRSRAQAYVGARFEFLIGSRLFERILHLPAAFTERAPVGGQVARLKSFEALREVFTGTLASTLVDLPFIFVFLIAIWAISGALVALPITLAAAFALTAWASHRQRQALTRAAGESRGERDQFLVELVWNLRLIRERNLAERWRERFRDISAATAWAGHRLGRFHEGLQNLAQSAMTAAGVGTLVIGVHLAIAGVMSMGALVATMMLVWRVLAPLQNLFQIGGRIGQVLESLDQLDGVMRLEAEQAPGDLPRTALKFAGAMEFRRVSLRYRSDANPALLGVSFRIEPGEMVAVTGSSGAGKTTLAKLALGLYRPQSGAILIDGVDIRQLKPITLRQTIAYVPQVNIVFPGSIYHNLALADPAASFAQIRKACRMAGILQTIEALPNGFETEFKEGLQLQLPQSFLRKVGLARAYLRDAPIVVLDEPAASMDEADEATFIQAIESLRGKRTILMISHRPSHIRMADRLLVMANGQVEAYGPPKPLLDRLSVRPDVGGADGSGPSTPSAGPGPGGAGGDNDPARQRGPTA